MYNRFKGLTDISPVVNVAALIIIFAAVIFAKTIITPLLLALFISIICVQPITWLEQKKVPRWLALILVTLIIIVIFSGFAFVLGEALSSFSGNLSKYESTLTAISNSFIQSLNDRGLRIPPDQISKLIQPAKILEYTATVLNTLFNMVGNTFLVFLITLFILMEFGSFSVKANAIRNETSRPISYFSIILKKVRHYLAIKTLLCLTVGFFTWLALVIIGVDYPLLWALIAALMNYIPTIGSIIATIPTVVFALVQLGGSGAFWTLISTIVIHNVIGNFIEPRIMGKGLGLSPLVVLLSLLFWGFVLGMVGMFLSVPLTMTIMIILDQNEKTKWITVLLGTPQDAEIHLTHRQAQDNPSTGSG